MNQRIVLADRPVGEARESDFRLETVSMPALQPGQVRVRHHWLSLDPYMRMRMNAAKNYAEPQPLDEVMIGGTAGEVVESRSERFAVGDHVVGMGGWQLYSVVDAALPGSLRKVDASRVPLSAYLGAVGMPGVTAWYGVTQILDPQPGQTLVVSAASGAVGSIVGQLAKARGCRVVGIAGGPEKCAWVVDELGFDACIDHRLHGDAPSLAGALGEAAPQGIDHDFENVGGRVFNAVLSRMNAHGRIALCGTIAAYDGQDMAITEPRLFLSQRLTLRGFIVSEHMELWPAALKELAEGVAGGRLRFRESVVQGLATAPAAFLGMLKGRNFGKQLVKLV